MPYALQTMSQTDSHAAEQFVKECSLCSPVINSKHIHTSILSKLVTYAA